MPTAPKYRINDLVYLDSSARIGQLESYRVGAIHDKGIGKYIYQIFIEQRPPAESTVASLNDLKFERELFFTETELLTGCEAMGIILLVLDAQIGRYLDRRADICIGSEFESRTSGVAVGQQLAPRFSVGDCVFMREPAKIGFLESHIITNIYRTPDQRQWKYHLDIRGDQRQRDRHGNFFLKPAQTVIPRIFFLENEIITECDALNFAIDNLDRRIIKMASDFVAVCEEAATTG